MYLVDTTIISATAPAKTTRAADLVAWMDQHSADLYVSAVSIAEIEAGIAGRLADRAQDMGMPPASPTWRSPPRRSTMASRS